MCNTYDTLIRIHMNKAFGIIDFNEFSTQKNEQAKDSEHHQ